MVEGRQLRVLIDTNVWLDAFLPGRTNKDASKRVLSRCKADDVASMYPPRAIQDVFFQVKVYVKRLIRREKGTLSEDWAHVANDQAWECVRAMRELATCASMNETDLWLACRLRDLHPDLEDDLVLAAAERVRADYLVTSDQRLIARATVAALTPQDMLAVLEARG